MVFFLSYLCLCVLFLIWFVISQNPLTIILMSILSSLRKQRRKAMRDWNVKTFLSVILIVIFIRVILLWGFLFLYCCLFLLLLCLWVLELNELCLQAFRLFPSFACVPKFVYVSVCVYLKQSSPESPVFSAFAIGLKNQWERHPWVAVSSLHSSSLPCALDLISSIIWPAPGCLTPSVPFVIFLARTGFLWFFSGSLT